MELRLISETNKESGSLTVSDSLFNKDYNEALVHQLVTSYLSNGRSVTRAQKGRSEIAKSNRKPWRQKGTGRARAGRASSPIWRGGGRIFPNSPDENYTKKINKKMYRAGISVILSQLLRDERLLAIDGFSVSSNKTRELVNKLSNLDLLDVMVITHELDDNLHLSSRNIPTVSVVEVKNVDPVSLLRYDTVLVTSAGIKKFEELLS